MRIFTLLLVVCLPAFSSAWSQTTGKITGTVRDADTGEALPGVNVLIEGTTQGTATDLNGEYVIIGVRPGTYTVVASFVGYGSVRQTGVQLSVDLTTTINFELSEQVLEGEEVVVTAEAVAVRKDLTSSEARVTSETIDRLPVQEIGQVLNMQAGVTTRDGALHIRGGRSSEVVVLVDGMPVTDNFDGTTAIQVENESIQELQVISGTFNAEHGNAMSGVINIVTKEGSTDRFRGSIEAYSGSYLVSGSGGEAMLRGVEVEEHLRQDIPYRDTDPFSYLDVDPTQYYNLSGSLRGPILGDRLTLFATGRYFRNDGWLYGARMYMPSGAYGDSSLVPMNTFEKLSWQGNLRFQLSRNIHVNLVALGSDSRQKDLGFENGRYLPYRWNPEGVPNYYDFGNDWTLKFTHLVSARTFYTLNFATFYREANRYRYEDPLDQRYHGNPFALGTPDSVEVLPGVWESVPSGGLRFLRGGLDLGHFNRKTRSFFAKGDVTSQISQHHLVKIGLEARLDRLSYLEYGLIPATDASGSVIEPFEPRIPPEEALGFQSFEDLEPISGSAYIQDKIEYEAFIVNAGLRLDFFDARADVPADPSDPNIHNPFKAIHRFRDLDGNGIISEDEQRDDNRLTRQDREAFWWTRVDPKVYVSPRLGMAYPITEQGVVHFSYGHFLQIPTLNRMFENFGYKVENRSGQYGPFGNPELEAQKTIMYEIGVRQGVGNVVLDITAYYRDVRNWVSTSTLLETELPGVSYVVYANRDYANTKGATLSVSRAFADRFGFDASYTYQVAEGSNSDPSEEFFALQGNAQPSLTLLPLRWDQRHKVTGAVYAGGRDWGASLLAVFGAGFPYTPAFSEAAIVGSDVQPEFPANSRRMASSFQLDLGAHRDIDLGAVRPRIFLQVNNVLDRRNVERVFGDTGRPDVTFNQPIASADPGLFVRPNHFSEPRRVHLGIQLNF